MPEYLDANGVADLYPGQTPSSLMVQRHRGKAPGVLGVRVGRRILWRRSDLEQWFDEQQSAQVAAKR